MRSRLGSGEKKKKDLFIFIKAGAAARRREDRERSLTSLFALFLLLRRTNTVFEWEHLLHPTQADLSGAKHQHRDSRLVVIEMWDALARGKKMEQESGKSLVFCVIDKPQCGRRLGVDYAREIKADGNAIRFAVLHFDTSAKTRLLLLPSANLECLETLCWIGSRNRHQHHRPRMPTIRRWNDLRTERPFSFSLILSQQRAANDRRAARNWLMAAANNSFAALSALYILNNS